MRRPTWRWPTMSKVKTPVKSGKEPLAQSLSYTWVAQTLGHASSVIRSTGVRAHQCQQRSLAGCAVEVGALAR
jgi:hypothetical protein